MATGFFPGLFWLVVPLGACLTAESLRFLLARWKGLFPENPYATSVALLPLKFLILPLS